MYTPGYGTPWVWYTLWHAGYGTPYGMLGIVHPMVHPGMDTPMYTRVWNTPRYTRVYAPWDTRVYAPWYTLGIYHHPGYTTLPYRPCYTVM